MRQQAMAMPPTHTHNKITHSNFPPAFLPPVFPPILLSHNRVRLNHQHRTIIPSPSPHTAGQTVPPFPFRKRHYPTACKPTAAPMDDPLPAGSKIAGTPCFTPRILVSPMSRQHRSVYLNAVTTAMNAYLEGLKARSSTVTLPPVAQLTLLAPQLNPSLDIYDRRFLLQMAWAVISSTVRTHAYRTRVLIQGRRAFGAIPLSVAGLRRNFDADLKATLEEWPDTIVRAGELEENADLDDDDEAIILLSPTNAVSIPVINAVMDIVDRAKGRPVVLINPRLGDVPSHSGVMQVSGRADRLAFVKRIQTVFYLRLLYAPGSAYPPRGILYKSWQEKWQIWRSENIDANYSMILKTDEQPDPSTISEAFVVDAYNQQKQFVQDSSESLTSVDIFLKPQFLIPILLLCSALIAARLLIQ